MNPPPTVRDIADDLLGMLGVTTLDPAELHALLASPQRLLNLRRSVLRGLPERRTLFNTILADVLMEGST